MKWRNTRVLVGGNASRKASSTVFNDYQTATSVATLRWQKGNDSKRRARIEEEYSSPLEFISEAGFDPMFYEALGQQYDGRDMSRRDVLRCCVVSSSLDPGAGHPCFCSSSIIRGQPTSHLRTVRYLATIIWERKYTAEKSGSWSCTCCGRFWTKPELLRLRDLANVVIILVPYSYCTSLRYCRRR